MAVPARLWKLFAAKLGGNAKKRLSGRPAESSAWNNCKVLLALRAPKPGWIAVTHGTTAGVHARCQPELVAAWSLHRSDGAFTMDIAWVPLERRRPQTEKCMAWTTPVLVEICIGLEINGYLPAEF